MPPKKRGRKPKKTKTTPVDEPKKVHKKRGRKPKGGKIIKKINEKINPDELKKPNIILQLKCSSKDLQKQEQGCVHHIGGPHRSPDRAVVSRYGPRPTVHRTRGQGLGLGCPIRCRFRANLPGRGQLDRSRR